VFRDEKATAGILILPDPQADQVPATGLLGSCSEGLEGINFPLFPHFGQA
jgi:hypothetical protein